MNPDTAPRALRCIIALIGRRNAGKSSLINALTGQEVAIVSAQPGTTTDAVAKPYELLPLGPVYLLRHRGTRRRRRTGRIADQGHPTGFI